MEGLILIAVIWFIFSAFKKGSKKETGSGNRRAGAWPPKPNPFAPTRPSAPGRPAVPPQWSEILTMLTDEQSGPEPQKTSEEGANTEYSEHSGSLAGPTMMGDEGSEYERSEPIYERPAISRAEPAEAPVPAATVRPGAAAMRDAIVWSEILAKPKALRRAVR